VRKVLLEDAVHLGEVGHVVEEDIDLYRGSALLFRLKLCFCADAKLASDDELQRGRMYLDDPVDFDTRLGQYPHNVLAALLRLVRNAALDQIALGVRRDLAGDIDLRASDDGLGLVKLSAYILPNTQSPQLSIVVRGRGIAVRGKPREEARLSIGG
jgi:hypothetical protein